MSTIEAKIITITANRCASVLQYSGYEVRVTDNLSITIEAKGKNNLALLNVKTESEITNEIRQRYIIVESNIDGSTLNRISFRDTSDACQHLVQRTLDLASASISSK